MPLMDAIHWYAELTRLIIESTLPFLFSSFILSRGGKICDREIRGILR